MRFISNVGVDTLSGRRSRGPLPALNSGGLGDSRPLTMGGCSQGAKAGAGDQVALGVEGVVDRRVG
jgi:hypothetical protein